MTTIANDQVNVRTHMLVPESQEEEPETKRRCEVWVGGKKRCGKPTPQFVCPVHGELVQDRGSWLFKR